MSAVCGVCSRCSSAECCGDSRALLDLRAALAASERSCAELEATNRLFSEALVGAARDAVCVRARIADAVRAAVADEREAIAKVVEDWSYDVGVEQHGRGYMREDDAQATLRVCAAAIRARGVQ